MTYDVVIIGAGMSGLAAGIRLAYFDKKVCILEQHSRIGGLNSYYTKGGYKFDVGLHAVTNYVSRNQKNKPLMRLLRQLRIDYDEFGLMPQKRSVIKFNDTALYFTNEFDVLKSEISEKFPGEIDRFLKLLAKINDYDELDLTNTEQLSARNVISKYIRSPLLIDMILCPLMFYGNPKEDDMDFYQFVIMFKSIFLEGFSRPYEGVRRILRVLKDKYLKCGGELCLNSGVKKIIDNSGKDIKIVLENSDEITARKVISSAGYAETMKLVRDDNAHSDILTGKLSFTESIYLLDKSPADIGFDDTIMFYVSADKFSYKRPDRLVDETSGVICSPNNFMYDAPLEDNIIRVTNISNSALWEKQNCDAYKKQKEESMAITLNEAQKQIGSFKENIIFTDSFTPRTIERYTRHIDGAVYGTENKVRDGQTDVENLYICGTDQGFLGITGAMLSGITIANLYALK